MILTENVIEPVAEAAALPGVFEHSVVLHDVPWEIYQALRWEENNNHLKMTYDRGELEIMSPRRKHEKISELTAQMVCQWVLLHNIEIEVGGNTTFCRKDLRRGLEPDHCYWIAHQAAVRGKDDIDLAFDPPPDLALEVEVSHSIITKLSIYEALGVPEVWRWRRGTWEVLRLSAARQYESQKQSLALPGFPLDLVAQLIEQRDIEGDTTLLKRFIKAISMSPPA